RARACALLRVARRGTVVLAAVRRLPAHVRRDRRRMARAALDRLAQLAVRRAGTRPCSARAHAGRGDRHRRMVSPSADAARLLAGLIERAALRHFAPAPSLSSPEGYKERRGAPAEQRAPRFTRRPVIIDASPANGTQRNTRARRRVMMRCEDEGGHPWTRPSSISTTASPMAA